MNAIDEKEIQTTTQEELVNIRTLWQLANTFNGRPVHYEPDCCPGTRRNMSGTFPLSEAPSSRGKIVSYAATYADGTVATIPVQEPTEETAQDAYAVAYLDKKRFPLTNRQNLSLGKQRMLDAINTDDMHDLLRDGKTLTPEQEAVAKEFEEKKKLREMLRPAPIL